MLGSRRASSCFLGPTKQVVVFGLYKAVCRLWEIVVASNGNQQELTVDTAADVLHRMNYPGPSISQHSRSIIRVHKGACAAIVAQCVH